MEAIDSSETPVEFTKRHFVITQKIVLFIGSAVGTTDPRFY
jgi:hypothetical protein